MDVIRDAAMKDEMLIRSGSKDRVLHLEVGKTILEHSVAWPPVCP